MMPTQFTPSPSPPNSHIRCRKGVGRQPTLDPGISCLSLPCAWPDTRMPAGRPTRGMDMMSFRNPLYAVAWILGMVGHFTRGASRLSYLRRMGSAVTPRALLRFKDPRTLCVGSEPTFPPDRNTCCLTPPLGDGRPLLRFLCCTLAAYDL